MKIKKHYTRLINTSIFMLSLAAAFSSHAVLESITQTSTPATNSIAQPASQSTSTNALTPGNSTNIWGELNFWTGAKFSSPYTINGSTHSLTNAGSKTDGYLEINLISRYVLRHGSYDDPVLRDEDKTPQDGRIHGVWPWQHFPDFDATIGYLFRGSSAPTNFNASTVVGSSDFYVDANVGFPILRYSDTNGTVKQQISLELGDGFVTDKNFLQIHHSAFVGLGYQGGFLLNGNQQMYWIGQAGVAEIDQPDLIGGTSTVKFNSQNEPIFNQKWVPSTGVIVVYPLTSSINLQAGINGYYSHNPANWNATLAVSLDLTKLSSLFSSK